MSFPVTSTYDAIDRHRTISMGREGALVYGRKPECSYEPSAESAKCMWVGLPLTVISCC